MSLSNSLTSSLSSSLTSSLVTGTFTPASLGNLGLWLDASDTSTITSVAGAVSQIDDKSGNSNHATQAVASSQPTTGTRTINGLNVLDLDGNARLDITNAAGIDPGSDDFTIFIVIAADVWDWRRGISFGTDKLEVKISPIYRIYVTDTTAGLDDYYQVSENYDHHVICIKRNGTSFKLFYDGVEGVSTTTSLTSSSDLSLLAPVGSTTGLNGAFAEAVAYNRALSDTEFNSINSYLSIKWGL